MIKIFYVQNYSKCFIFSSVFMTYDSCKVEPMRYHDCRLINFSQRSALRSQKLAVLINPFDHIGDSGVRELQ